MNPRQYLTNIKDYYWMFDNDSAYSSEKFLILPSINFHISTKYIHQTIKELVPFGLPPMGIICIFYYNTSSSAYDQKNGLLYHINHLQKQYDVEVNIDAAINFINNLSEIPKKIFSKLKLSDLIKLFCENHSKLVHPEDAQLINNYIDSYYQNLLNNDEYNHYDLKQTLENDINFLVELNYKFPTKESIENILQNFFTVDIKNENTEDELLEESIEEFFGKLERNKNTENLPFQINYLWNNLKKDIIKKTIGEMTLGGIQSITNKGKIEQLLLSEFAYDDLNFLNRFINNESLYIKREIPPIEEEKTHHFLIDLSINSWGIPKELMFSVCLSFIKHKKLELIYKTWLIGNRFEEIELNDSSDVFNAFDYLSINEYPINGFEDFIKNIDNFNQQEIYLCINYNTFESKEFKAFLVQNISVIKLIFVVKRDQTIQFYKIKNHKKHLHHSIKIPQNKQRRINSSSCQILLPYLAKKSNKIFYLDKHFYILTSNNDLLKSYHKTDDKSYYGVYKLLHQKIPQFYKNCVLGKQNGELFLAGIAKNSQKIVVYNLDRKIWKRVDYKDASSSRLYYMNDFLISDKYNNFKIIFDNSLNNVQIKHITDNSSYYNNNYNNIQKEEIIPFQKFNISKEKKLTINGLELIFTEQNAYLEEQDHNLFIYQNLIRKNDRIKINDESFINIDYLGIATIHDNFNNQKIYIPLSHDRSLALATDEYFCGNEEYFDEESNLKIISPLEFEELIIKPFIEKLISNERN